MNSSSSFGPITRLQVGLGSPLTSSVTVPAVSLMGCPFPNGDLGHSLPQANPETRGANGC